MTRTRVPSPVFIILIVSTLFSITASKAHSADINECRRLLITGQLEECLNETEAAIEDGVYGESWHILKAEAQFDLGRYQDSLTTIDQALERYSWSIRLRTAAIEACQFTGQTDRIETLYEEIGQLVQGSPWRYTDAENLITLGRFILERGADAKQVQETFFARARRNNPLHRSPILALGELALDKRDFQLAAEIFEGALENHADDPDIHFGVARAFRESDSEVSTAALQKTLKLNPHHVGAHLMQVDSLIDREQYDEANQVIDQILNVNSSHPEALAFRSAILSLQGRDEQAIDAYEAALEHWETNPLVDHVIGRELSQKYRFEEGSKRQQQALEFDQTYLAAKKQLVQDFMRLGREDEGWRLAEELHQNDPYDIAMYNLVTLRHELENFTTISENNFFIRMEPAEAEIYGQRVLKLLTQARQQLTEKYRIELPETILVEIFPKPADFEVRTFGMPGIPGFLGVCFGDVITANSPASQSQNPVNLESVLWHEFAHVITLNKTNNRMPRWLSEGLSVYEERMKDPSWGEQMNSTYRKMILEGSLSSIRNMSDLFLSPESPIHVQFAYFQSSLVVKFLIDRYGFDAILAILDDLAIGMNTNEAIERHTAPIAEIDEAFEEHALALANDFGGEVDWSEPELADVISSPLGPTAIIAWVEANPTNYVGLKQCASILLEADERTAAAEVLEKAVELFPYETGPDSPSMQLAEIYRSQDMIEKESDILNEIVNRDPDAVSPLMRLMELSQENEDWDKLAEYSTRLLAIKPLIPQPHAGLALAGEKLNHPDEAASSLEALLQMNPADPAGIHYRAAAQYQKLGDKPRAIRSSLQALEEAPRYMDALKLFVELQTTQDSSEAEPEPELLQ
ncbi:Tetratricopeptide repeat protein [Thalassoglobus neptunius]|uniref:Tetratricopeptide repeat protein n=1 Tax=Thalassoglobus neptunius TaxID=1938619 RepID=A0A5C5X6I4_9PLAN|nr:tetratricopeptide repeat protein [Thalassoglobus neptunius]TWT58524.1 Tetratricopeptide repeat protein [Thalassoglobus neptunius]